MTTVKLTAKEKRAIQENFEAELAEKAAFEFRKALPKKLKELEQFASSLGVYNHVSLTETGPVVHFRDDNCYIDKKLSYDSEEWEVNDLEGALTSLKKDQDYMLHLRTLALSIIDAQTDEGKVALTIYYDTMRK